MLQYVFEGIIITVKARVHLHKLYEIMWRITIFIILDLIIQLSLLIKNLSHFHKKMFKLILHISYV